MPHAFLACGAANDVLRQVTPGSVRLFNFSPPYLGLVDYEKAAETGDNRTSWRGGDRALHLGDYIDEMLSTAALLFEAAAPDAVLCAEVDDVRVPGRGQLIPLSGIWRQILEASGWRIAEEIALVRQIEIGHRSGLFVQHAKPGYFYPGEVVSDLLVAFKGEPQARLQRDATEADRIDMHWARRFLKNAWSVSVPDAWQRKDRAGHPCPQDPEIIRAAVCLYSLRGDLVADPFAGEGTTGWVSLDEGRNALLVEVLRRNAEAIRRRLPTEPLPLGDIPGRVQIPGSQIYLPLDDVASARMRRAFLTASRAGEVTDRLRQMARQATRLSGVEIPPELLSIVLRAERDYYGQRRA